MLAQTPNWDSPLGLDPLMPIPSGSPSSVMEAIDGSDHHWVILAERRRVAWLSRLSGTPRTTVFKVILPGCILKKH